MLWKCRRFLRAVFVALLVAYTTLLTYQSLTRADLVSSNSNNNNNAQQQLSHVVGKIEGGHLKNSSEERAGRILQEGAGDFTVEIPSATATIKPPTTRLDDVFISVKTTKQYHEQRLAIIIKTWFQMAKSQTWFFTDEEDEEYQQKTNGHMINTKCSSSHERRALCCKMSVEFDTFIESEKKWFCHFDDDNYVNVPRLVRFLGDYNPREDWYFGKPSIQAPVEIFKDKNLWFYKSSKTIKFWFATGGAGFCLSRAIALKMIPFASEGRFIRTCEKIRMPDDVTMGYIIEHLLKKPLTVVDQFHSHLEPMKFIRRDMIKDQISLSYKYKNELNVVKIEGFDPKYDPNRFLSLHCFLFPHVNFCPM